MARTFKKLTDYKLNDSAQNEKGPIVQGKIGIVKIDGQMRLVLEMPLSVTSDQCRVFDDEVERNGKTEIVPKGNMVVSFEIPENLELEVDGINFRVKRGGMAAKRYFTLGFDPRNGYRRVPVIEDDTTAESADETADEVIEETAETASV